MSDAIKDRLAQRLDELSDEEQRRVLDFADSISERPRGTPGRQLLRFAGTISAEDVRLMEQAIEEQCERIDPTPEVDFDR